MAPEWRRFNIAIQSTRYNTRRRYVYILTVDLVRGLKRLQSILAPRWPGSAVIDSFSSTINRTSSFHTQSCIHNVLMTRVRDRTSRFDAQAGTLRHTPDVAGPSGKSTRFARAPSCKQRSRHGEIDVTNNVNVTTSYVLHANIDNVRRDATRQPVARVYRRNECTLEKYKFTHRIHRGLNPDV